MKVQKVMIGIINKWTKGEDLSACHVTLLFCFMTDAESYEDIVVA